MSWAEKAIQAKTRREQLKLIQEGVQAYGSRVNRLINETPWTDMPLLITAMRGSAEAMERMLAEEGRETVRLLTERTQTIAVDLDELRRQGK